MNRQLPVTLLLADPALRRAVQGFFSSRSWYAPAGTGPAGLVVLDREAAGPDYAAAAVLLDTAGVRDVLVLAPALDPDDLLAAMRAGVREVLPLPLDSAAMDAACDRILSRDGARPAQSSPDDNGQGRVLAVAGCKGGVGTTTVALNLAAELAGARSLRNVADRGVAFLELHVGLPDAPLLLDLAPEYDLGEALRNLDRLDPAYLAGITVRHGSGLAVLPASGDHEAASLASEAAASRIMDISRQAFACTVVDAGNSLDETALAVLRRADDVLLVATLALPALARLRRTVEALVALDQALADRVRIIFNRHLSCSEVSLAEAEEIAGRPAFFLLPNDYESALAAANLGKPLSAAVPRSRLAESLRRLAGRLGDVAPSGTRQGRAWSPLHLFRRPAAA
jgi:pilus assembly protein CpaE